MHRQRAKIVLLLLASGLFCGAFSSHAEAAMHYYRLRLSHTSVVYNQKGKRIKKLPLLKKNSYVRVSRSKKIGKTKFLQMRKNTFVKAANVKIPQKTYKRISYQLKPAVVKQIQQTMNQLGFKGNLTVYHQQKKIYTLTTANSANSAYLINSTQKFLTGGLVMQAAQRHELKLTDHLSKYYPQIPGSHQITLRDLLNMQAGLSLKPGTKLGSVPFVSDDKTLKAAIPNMVFDQDMLGVQKYESMNFAILSNVAAKASHASYQKLFTDTYIKKQGLKHTAFVWDQPQELRRIHFVQNPMDMDEVHGELGAGSVAMTNDDLYYIANRMLTGKILNKRAVAQLYEFNQDEDPMHTYHGGFYVNSDSLYNNGAGYHYYTFLRLSKDGQNGLIAQTNQGSNYKANRSATMDLFSLINDPNSYQKSVKTYKKSLF